MNRIKLLREKSKLTQKELANKIGQSPSNISKYELGILEPNISALKELSNIFNVSIDYLIGSTDVPDKLSLEFKPSSYIYILDDSGIGEKIEIPQNHTQRLKALLDAGFPELFQSTQKK